MISPGRHSRTGVLVRRGLVEPASNTATFHVSRDSDWLQPLAAGALCREADGAKVWQAATTPGVLAGQCGPRRDRHLRSGLSTWPDVPSPMGPDLSSLISRTCRSAHGPHAKDHVVVRQHFIFRLDDKPDRKGCRTAVETDRVCHEGCEPDVGVALR